MLIEFRVENFRSFRDEQVFSLVAARSDDTLPDNCIPWGEEDRLLRTAALYGPNASGKSNLVHAIRAMRRMVVSSANESPGQPTVASPFKLDSASRDKPTTFEVSFIHEGARYQYGFSVDRQRVLEEWLYAFPIKQARRWFHREFEEKVGEYTWKFGPDLGQKKRLAELTRPEGLFLSVGARLNQEKLSAVYEWFDTKLRFLDLASTTEWLTQTTAKFVLDIESTKRKAFGRLLQRADLGIDDVRVTAREIKDARPEALLRALATASKEADAGFAERPFYEVQAHHASDGLPEGVWLDWDEESRGTQRFFGLAGPWLDATVSGYVVFVDELETSMHPLLARALLSVAQAPAVNSANAQVIFTTHNTSLMDSELFRRDQIWFTEKDQDGASRLFSLYDYRQKPRKTEAWEKGYLAGRYGAVPILKEFGLE